MPVSVRRLALAFLWSAIGLTPASAAEPGTVPDGAPRIAQSTDAQGPSSGLKAIYREFGRLRLSVDGAGGAATLSVTAEKPNSKAKVVKAYLFSATYGGAELPNLSVALDGKPLKWTARQPNVFGDVIAGAADVTKAVRGKLDAAAPGLVTFQVTQNALPTGGFDGHILAVVFSSPTDPKPRTVALLFGGAGVGGEAFGLTLGKPIDPKAKDARAEMGLGIAGSYQGTGQYTIVDVNGQRLTSSAGGQDDGAPFDGGLITVGGLGDRAKNPAPDALPVDAATDDERYSLLKFLSRKTKSIEVRTSNPSQNDNLFFAWFDMSASTEDDGADTDGDGLLDAWEKNGYDHDGDGRIDVDLKRLGANWRRKDLFVAYAWMLPGAGESQSHKPSAAVLKQVSDAFARAPVSNPDGSRGVAVHFRNLGSVPHDDDLNPVFVEFDRIMDPLLTAAERRIYRRMLNAHAYGGGGSSGIARDIPASDFIESLGKFSTNPGTPIQRAGTIMHELGHTLGLRHGGVDHENYKPNHLSVMSYLHQLDGLTRDGAPWLDYERFNLADLDENALNEIAGLDDPAAESQLARYGARWLRFGARVEKASGANENVDWDRDGAIEALTASNLNNVSSFTVLKAGFVEWDNLILDGGLIGATSAYDVRRSLRTDPTDLVELTEQEYLETKRKRGR